MGRISIVFLGKCLRGGHCHFLKQCRVKGRKATATVGQNATASGGGKATSACKKDSSKFKCSMSPASSCLPTCLKSTYRIPFFPNQCPHLNSRCPMRLGIQLPFNSANRMMRTCVWFLAISALWLQERKFFHRVHLEASEVMYALLELGIWIP